MRSFREITDRQIIRIALILWLLTGVGSLLTNNYSYAVSALIAIALGLYGLRLMRKRERN